MAGDRMGEERARKVEGCRLCGAILAAARDARRARGLGSGADGAQRHARRIWQAVLQGRLQLVAPGGAGARGGEGRRPG